MLPHPPHLHKLFLRPFSSQIQPAMWGWVVTLCYYWAALLVGSFVSWKGAEEKGER